MQVGAYRPVTRGIPVVAGTEYRASFYAKSANASTPNAVTQIIWYNRRGEELFTSEETSEASISTSWGRYGVTATAPGTAFDATYYSVTDNVVTLGFAEAHSFSSGQAVTVAGFGAELDGIVTVLTSSEFEITFSKLAEDVELTELTSVVTVSTEAATYAALSIGFDDSATAYIDLVQFAATTPEDEDPAYEEARGVNIFLESSKENYLNNPSFDSSGEAWTVTGIDSSSEYVDSTLPYVFVGNSMLAVTPFEGMETTVSSTTAAGDKPVEKSYVFSTYAKVASNTETVKLRVTATDETSTSIFESAEVELTTEWSRPYLELFVEDSFDSNLLSFTVEIVVENPTGETIYLDAAQLEEAYQPSDYFDGSFPAEYGVTWSGTAHASSSHCYKNKQVKIIRLIQELETNLPSNTPYFVSSYAGTEVTGITM